MRARSYIAIIWVCFVVRAHFYSAAFPLWEGFDEWAHFAVAENMRVTLHALVDRNVHVALDTEASLELVPLPRGLTATIHNGTTYAAYWELSPDERLQRQHTLQELPPMWADDTTGSLPAYEASQPPLYYWILAIPLHAVRSHSLLTRVWLARSESILIGSLVIPLSYLLAIQFFDWWIAIALTAFIALLPELTMTISRVSNESLAIVIFAALIIATVQGADAPNSYRRSLLVGILLSAGLLTKAYFLTAIPAILSVRLIFWMRKGTARQFVLHSLVLLIVVAVLAGWWYARNIIETGTLSGLDEAQMLKAASLTDRLNGALHVDWLKAIATVMVSHIWYSGWSLLALPHFIYYACFGFIGVACAGLIKGLAKPIETRVAILLCFYGFFWLGQTYQIVSLFLSKGSSTALGGWYLCALVSAEAVFLMIGLRYIAPCRFQHFMIIVFVLGTAAIDLYGLHAIALPYFGHSSFATPHQLFEQLLINKPEGISLMWLECMWGVSILSTLILAGIGTRMAWVHQRKIESPEENRLEL